ncbi:hypothetical protein [Cardinium endosymbiont of Nabis limbatus]|uniref:hypothetical protein n=1 Tax=Cardinium endosymbiont of Nabis limbatus TaxID=3066217 RepID=UPI003AF3FAC8
MSKKLWLGWGALLSSLFIWFFISNKDHIKVKKKLYGALQRASLSIITKRLLKPWVKKIIPLLF